MRCFAVVICLAIASPAGAVCIRSSIGYTFQDQVNNSFDYLGCLYDDAARVSRQHADKINEQSELINQQNQTIYKLMQEVDELKDKIDQNRVGHEIFQSQIDALKRKTADLPDRN